MEEQETFSSDEIAPKKKGSLTTIILVIVITFAFTGSALVTLDILGITSFNPLAMFQDSQNTNTPISAESQVNGISINIKNEKPLLEYANSQNLFEDQAITNVQLILTAEEQNSDLYASPDKTIIQSSSHEVNNNTLTIKVFLNEEKVLSAMDTETIADRFSHAVMLRMLKITNKEADVGTEEITEKIIPYIDGNNEIITVNK